MTPRKKPRPKKATKTKSAKSKTKKMAGRKRGGASMICPDCGSDSRVMITRRISGSVYRKRKCVAQGHEFETNEEIVKIARTGAGKA